MNMNLTVKTPPIYLKGTNAESLREGVTKLDVQIAECDDRAAAILQEVERLRESLTQTETERERLTKERNALRSAIRFIEDSE